MKKMQSLLVGVAALLAGYSATLRAEDIDVYVDNAGTSGVPNVLFVIDNGANFSATAKVGCAGYKDGSGAPSMGTSTAAGVLQCALVDAINSLPPDGALNIGLMTSNGNNFANDVRQPNDLAYHERCITDTGGCLLRKLTLMEGSNKLNLINFIKSWDGSKQTSDTTFNIKVNSALPGTMMQEAWAYFNGKVGMSGTQYNGSLLASGCQKNVIIYIANAEKTPAGESPSPFDGTNALTSVQVGATADQKLKISRTVTFDPKACGVSSIAAKASQSDWSENWADEWARLMYQQDGGAMVAEGAQNITTYTVAILNNETCTADYPALMANMADYSGGKAFRTSDVTEVTRALNAVLNEVQAVNSVFSSASLPVSVNAEGSYLNQIYLGMFRPDATGAPRWLGNLKQYQLVRKDGSLVLGDATGQPAISSAGTGFISPNAVSLWTSKKSAEVPDSGGGYFVNDRKGVPLSGFDLPDGEVVEKGGAAQQLRLQNLTATDFGGAIGTNNPRKLYTYCPTGDPASCVASLTDSSNHFVASNVGIAATAFGVSSAIPISSIVRTGSNALVTTTGNHGFATNASVTIGNVTQEGYNGTRTITVNSSTTFTITGLTDYPVTPSAGAYTVSLAGAASSAVTSIVRATSTSGGRNVETATITTAAPHTFTTASKLAVVGASPANFAFSGFPVTAVPGTTELTFDVAIEPPSNPINTYQVRISPTAYQAKPVDLSKVDNTTLQGTTSGAHNFHIGQKIVVSGATSNKYEGTLTVSSVSNNGLTFQATGASLSGNVNAGSGAVAPDTSVADLVSLTREATTVSATASATVGAWPGAWSGTGAGDATGKTKIVTISQVEVFATNESAYVKSDVTITCLNSTCTRFSYPITVTPSVAAMGTMTVGTVGASAAISAGSITRTNRTARVSNVTPNVFKDGDIVIISASDELRTSESAYVGEWKISCTVADCSTFTYGNVQLTPDTPATGVNMQAYSGSTPPDRDSIIKWVRGADIQGDEKGPGGTVTVRPSVHGDVLHSRPLVINHGGDKGIVVYYGANDGVFRAVNGNQTAAIGSVPAGGELWGLVLPEHYGKLNRLRVNAPELKFPSSPLASAQFKDYFVDGPTSSYQLLIADGTVVETAYIYLTMRRGGRFIYALDVTTPSSPSVLWRKSFLDDGFGELGQTWSRPRLTFIEGGGLATTPVLVFGAGYDIAQDAEPPTANSMGRGIMVLNALTGDLIWQANSTCTTSATCRKVPGMNYAIPSDVTLVDRDYDDKVDKFYVGDTGGNVWRVDVSAASTADWTVTKLAALGCDDGTAPNPTCTGGKAPRKFFFPPSILSVRAAGALDSFDVVSMASGDREHPLKSVATGSSYLVNDRFFMVKDVGTAVRTGADTDVALPSTSNVVLSALFNATTQTPESTYNLTRPEPGFYFTLKTGEKAVNAPLANRGEVFFATNRPVDRANTCAANLGEATAYAVNPFTAIRVSNILAGGGMPPSAVAGTVIIDAKNDAGEVTGSTKEHFCLGCGITREDPGEPTTVCDSALQNCDDKRAFPKNLKRNYWYKK